MSPHIPRIARILAGLACAFAAGAFPRGTHQVTARLYVSTIKVSPDGKSIVMGSLNDKWVWTFTPTAK